MAKQTNKPKTTDEWNALAAAAADAAGVCQVKGLIPGVTNNGHTYALGETFPMERSLAAAHAEAGQVEIVAGAGNSR